MFLFYTDSDNLDWPEIQNLTAGYLKQLCSYVVVNLTGSLTTEDRLVYIYPKGKVVPPERIIRRAPVQFPEGVKYMKLLQCAYYIRSFYIARGGEKSVFRLDKDRQKELYYLMSGLHPVEYNSILNTTYYIAQDLEAWQFKL